MFEITILFYDKMLLENNIKRFLPNVEIIENKYAFTYGILRATIHEKYHYFKSTNKNKIIFGKSVKLLMDESDLELLKIIYSEYELTKVKAYILKDVKDLTTCDYKVEKIEEIYIFESKYKTLKNNRHNNAGNMSKFLLIS